MLDAARYAAMADPDRNPAFRRIWTESAPAPVRRQPRRDLDRLAVEILADWRRVRPVVA